MNNSDKGLEQSVERALALLPRHQRDAFVAEVKEARNRKRVKKEGGEWLLGYHWQAFGTLTFAWEVTPETAIRLTAAWIRTSFGRQAYAYVVPETGPRGERVHIHTLIGGTKKGRNLLNARLGLWDHGDRRQSELKPFRPGEGGAEYVTKTLPAAGSGEFVGRPKKFRPKKRGRGRRR